MKIRRFYFDMPLFFALLLLSIVSLFILYSAAGENHKVIFNQAVRIGVAFIVMIAIAQISPGTLYRWSPYLYTAGLIMLFLVLLVGITSKGAQRWLDLGVRFQPSEVMKLSVPMMVAWVLTRHPLPPRYREIFYATLVLAIPAALIFKQPDLGTAILISFSGLLIIFLAGLSWRLIGYVAACCVVAAPFVWHFVLLDYHKGRILTLFDPWSDPRGAGYHTIQSMIAIGSGGLQGKGWLSGSQSQLEFIPERKTDFIFSVFSEEFGLIGVVLLLLLYLIIVARGLYIAFYTKDTYARLLSGGLSMTFFFYVFVNIGMVSGMLPVVGVPLPLISFGGTSMVTLMAGFGILMSIHTHRNLMSR